MFNDINKPCFFENINIILKNLAKDFIIRDLRN